jgi:hypothetical protein
MQLKFKHWVQLAVNWLRSWKIEVVPESEMRKRLSEREKK